MCSGFSVEDIYVVGDREEVVMLDAVSSYVLQHRRSSSRPHVRDPETDAWISLRDMRLHP